MRLLCFPHAGAGSLAYLAWTHAFGPDVEVCAVQLPGRETRLDERAVPEIDRLLPPLVDAVAALVGDESFAFFGHSFGALLAFEVTRMLRDRGALLPRLLVVSGRIAPCVTTCSERLSELDDQALIAEISHRYGGIPREVLAEPELLEMLLPALRADLKITESYEYRPTPPLATPIVAFGGVEDHAVSREALGQWSRETRDFRLQMFAGGHFFIHDSRRAVLEAVAESLGRDRLPEPADARATP